MTIPIDPDTLTDPRDAAAYWFARERSGSMDDADRQRLDNWRRAHPEHEREYRRALGIWNVAGMIPSERLRTLAGEPRKQDAPSLGRRRLALGLGTACAAAIVAAVVLPESESPGYSQEFSTEHGKRRQIALPDGSTVDLNSGTSLAVSFYNGRRVIELAAGEAAFAVTHDADRPFYVRAADTVVRVTGTRFGVRLDVRQVRVTVESGSVEVRQGSWWNRDTTKLSAGQTVQANAEGLAPVQHADAGALLAWRRGRVVFHDTPLSEAVAEMNRYAPQAIKLGDAGAGRMRVAGVFSTDDMQPFLDLLPAIAPVRVWHRPDGTPVIASR